MQGVSDAFAVFSGLLNAVQSGRNPMLGRSIGQMPAAVIGLVSGQLAWPSAGQPAGAPWRAWAGGMLGRRPSRRSCSSPGKLGPACSSP